MHARLLVLTLWLLHFVCSMAVLPIAGPKCGAGPRSEDLGGSPQQAAAAAACWQCYLWAGASWPDKCRCSATCAFEDWESIYDHSFLWDMSALSAGPIPPLAAGPYAAGPDLQAAPQAPHLTA